MPYIVPLHREALDPLIDQLAQGIVDQANWEGKHDANPAIISGLINYSVTRLILKVIKLKFGAVRYWIVALVTGTLHNIADEFYRRLGTPYEDYCICSNGDVDLYKEYAAEIGAKYQALEK